MYSSLKDLHSYWAIGVLGLLVIAILNSFAGLSQRKPFLDRDKKIAMFALIFAHVQFVIGIIMYITSPYLETAKQLGMGAVMKDKTLRLYLVEHPLINIIALVLITIGWSTHKRAEDDAVKFKKIAYLYTAGLLLLLSRIPWSAWLS